MFGDALGFVATVVEDEFFGNTIFTERLEFGDELVIGLVPSDALPLALASLTYATEWVENTFRVVSVGDHALSLGTEVALGVRVEGITFDLSNKAVLNPTDDAAVIGAGEADGRSRFGLGVVEARERLGEGGFNLGANGHEGTGGECGSEFEKGAARSDCSHDGKEN